MSSSPAWSPVLNAIVKQGAWFVLSRFETQEKIVAATRALIEEGVERLQGSGARRDLAVRGLWALHEVLPAEQIGPLRDFVMTRLRPGLLSFACLVGRKFLAIEGEFFID